MIFYLALDTEGYRQLRGTQVDAKSVNKAFDQIDIPVDKQGLCGAIQELLTEADMANRAGPDQDPEAIDRADKIRVQARNTKDGIVLGLADHDSRCRKCHLVLTASESGAKLLAAGEDMMALQEWIDFMPLWAVDGVADAIKERRDCEIDDSQVEESPATPELDGN